MTQPGIGRRAFLAGSAAATGLLVSRGLGVRGLGAPPETADLGEALRELVASLTPGQRAQILLPANHPSRQTTNTIAFLDRPHIATLVSPRQLVLVERLRDAMLSPKGRHDMAGTFAVEGKFEGCTLVVYGDPAKGPSQVALMGGHVHLRGGDLGRDPLGGGVAYGHQIGNGQWKVPGNGFAHHGHAANALFEAFDEAERAGAIAPTAPSELLLQPQGPGGRFDGIRLGSASEPAHEAASALLDTVLSTWPGPDARAAREAIDGNGGLGNLHAAFYESHGFFEDMRPVADLDAADRAARGVPYWQVWRLEGPGTVIHFQGYPHVHAYVQIVRDPNAWHTGETLARVDRTIEGDAMRALLEDALCGATGAPGGFHGEEVFGRFCPGEVTTGLAWSVDPYGNRVATMEIEGRAMAAPLRERLAARGTTVEDGRTYVVATSDYFASRADLVGEPARVEVDGRRVGEALAEHVGRGAALG